MSPLQRLAPRLPFRTAPATDKPGSKEHSEEEWVAKKSIIRQLYITDNFKLNKTMAIMESRHGFYAT